MIFADFNDLTNEINTGLGDFCNRFQYTRKELTRSGRTAGNDQLFGNVKDENWAINKGAGTEIQYHLNFDIDDMDVRYGLGFNTQYVPFKNEMSATDYVRPFMNAFLAMQSSIEVQLPDYTFVIGDIDQLKNPQQNQYALYGKKVHVKKVAGGFFMGDSDFSMILEDLRRQFEVYKDIFKKRNEMIRNGESIQDLVQLLLDKKQIILHGPPGTGKTYTAKDLAEKVITTKVSANKKDQSEILVKSGRFKLIQFHPAYSYEDFVRGIVVESPGGQIVYRTQNKILGEFAAEARQNLEDSKKDVPEISREKWVQKKLDLFRDYLLERLNREMQIQISDKVYVYRIDDFTVRYKGDVWQLDGGVPYTDIEKMFLSDVKTLDDIKNLSSLTRTAQYNSGYWLRVLTLFKEFLNGEIPPTSGTPKTEVKSYVLIIDEINRANLPAVLGELIYALEYRDEPVDSMYELDEGGRHIVLPQNLYIIGTMNSADRSVGHIDYAIRRRFAFQPILPDESVITGAEAKNLFAKVKQLFVNDKGENATYLAPDFRWEDVIIGHSYFLENDLGRLKRRLETEIKPLLMEYMRDGILGERAESEIQQLDV